MNWLPHTTYNIPMRKSYRNPRRNFWLEIQSELEHTQLPWENPIGISWGISQLTHCKLATQWNIHNSHDTIQLEFHGEFPIGNSLTIWHQIKYTQFPRQYYRNPLCKFSIGICGWIGQPVTRKKKIPMRKSHRSFIGYFLLEPHWELPTSWNIVKSLEKIP